ncbi:hypothetical protein OG617_00545 [Micromonospora sp. NBC_01412]
MIDVQSESKVDLIRAGHAHRFSTAGEIVNPGALMIAGWSLRDALASLCWLRWRKASSWALALSATGWPPVPFCICSTVANGHTRFPESEGNNSEVLAQRPFSPVGRARRTASLGCLVCGGAIRLL